MQKRQSSDSHSIPSLQIAPRLQAVAEGDGALLGFLPSARVWAGLAAMGAAAAVAACAFVLIHQTHSRPVSYLVPRVAVAKITSGRPASSRSRPLPVVIGPGSAVAAGGARLMTLGGAVGSVGSAGAGVAAAQSVSSSAHDLTGAELTSLVDGTSSYEPPAYLAAAYREAAQRYRISWALLAALEYIRGGYTNAVAGASATPLQAVAAQTGDGRGGVTPGLLSSGVAAASGPSPELLGDAQRLAADGASRDPARALPAYLQGASSPQAVLTLAQEIGDATVTGSSAPMAKLVAMRTTARVLNGLPYVWGGGHQNPAWVVGSGYDCSGFVSTVLHSAGYLNSPDTTQTLPGSAGIAKGAGKFVTLYDRTDGGLKVWRQERRAFLKKIAAENKNSKGVHFNSAGHSVSMRLPPSLVHPPNFDVPNPDNSLQDDHVIIDLNGQWWESGGDAQDGGAERVHELPGPPSAGYLNSFNLILHPVGL